MPLQMRTHGRAGSRLLGLSRPHLFAGLFLLGCANGLAIRVGRSIGEDGWLDAVVGTFDISLIVLAACFVGVWLVFCDRTERTGSVDFVVTIIFATLVIPPITSLSWVAVFVLSFYILTFTDAGESGRRGAIILLAATVPMLWTPWLFDFFTQPILRFDALLVGWVLKSNRIGTFVEMPDQEIMIFPACSSLPNMALAFLLWVTLSQSVQHKWRPRDLLWCSVVIGAVLALNVARISLGGWSLPFYFATHSPLGELISNVTMLGLTVGICMLGVRRDIFSRA
jgi:hypothetical protein